jgi:hypothetical protein
MKYTALLALSSLIFSYPVIAKPHYLHHHQFHHYTLQHHHDAAARKLRQADRYTAHASHSGITCEMVRAYVAKVGMGQAIAMAKSAGISAADEERARQCLAKRI